MSDSSGRVELGRINGAWGTAGWVKVYSLTQPPENIFEYQPWHTDGAPGLLHVREWRRQGPRLVAELEEVGDRDAAEALRGAKLFVDRDELPEPEPASWYWHDLIGLEVFDREGRTLGRVAGLVDVGAHDVLRVQRADRGPEILIPFVRERYVLGVDLDAGRIDVDWDPAWLEESPESG